MAVAAVIGTTGAGGAPAARHSHRGWCEARSSVIWRRVVARHVVALSRTASLVPLALAHDGRSFFAGAYLPKFAGVARIDTKTGRLTRIKAFPDPQYDQAWAALDGRWLVWNEYHGFDGFNDFTTWAWDLRARRLTRLGAAARAPSGQFWDSPWRGPDVRDGMATWVQGVGPDQLGDIHTYDLRTGRDLVVRHGHPGGAFLLDHRMVVWAEAPAPGSPTRMHAASAVTGAHVRLPPALRSLRNVTGLQTDGHGIAYPNASYKSLWWSPTPRALPSRVIGTQHFQHVDNSVRVSGRYVAFGIYPGVFVADTRLQRYVRVSTHGGSALVDSTDLLVTDGPMKKALHPLLRMSFVPLRDLPPVPACS